MSVANFDLKEHPHRRFNPLTRQWILVSPHRNQRPWLGQVETVAGGGARGPCPGCDICSGKTRAAGGAKTGYQKTNVFYKEYSHLLPLTPSRPRDVDRIIVGG